MNLGSFIKQKRLENGMTLEQLGKRVGVSKMTVTRWEKGEIKNIKTDKIEKLARALGVPVIALFEGFDESGNENNKDNQISPREFADEIIPKIQKVTNWSDKKKQLVINQIKLMCYDDENK